VTDIATASDSLDVLRVSLREQLAGLRGQPPDALPPALLDIRVRRVRVPGGDVFLVQPADWEQLRHEEGGAGRGVPYWATPWPSGAVLAGALAEDPPPPGARVLELGCGLGLPSIVAARAGGRVLATDWSPAAIELLRANAERNGVSLELEVVSWAAPEPLLERAPFDLVLAADVLYERRNVPVLAELLPRLGREVLLADPGRPPLEDFLAQVGTVWRRPPVFRLR
jgi:predicted nicotinamide N-methyase